MKTITGSDRLDKIMSMIPVSRSVADVGCDHAKLSIALVKEHLAEKVWAMDLREGPLQKACQSIQRAGLQKEIPTVLSDGLTKLIEDVETIVIAGMGGETIAHILFSEEGHTKERVQNAKHFVLSPQSEWLELRKLLAENRFSIHKEDMVLDKGKYYLILLVEHANTEHATEPAEDLSLYPFGTYLTQTQNPCFMQYLEKEIKTETALYERLSKENQKAPSDALTKSLAGHQKKLFELKREYERIQIKKV